jgi:MATE family multidrug resistance protein
MATVSPHQRPLREVIAIAGPTVATMTSYTLMTFTDKYLVSLIGPEPIYVGAQGNGGLVSWVPISIAHGTLAIVNTFVAQNLGAGRPERAPAYAWNGIWLSVAFWLLVLVPFSFLLPQALDLPRRLTDVLGGDGSAYTGMDREQHRLAVEYGRILLWGAVLTLATRCLSQYFFGMHRAGIVMVASVIANAFNIVASYALIFGRWGMPQMGVAGSALGTVLATVVEFAIPLAVFLGREFHGRYGTRHAWRFSWARSREILSLGWPGGAMFGNEMICWGIFMVYLVSGFGREHATAGWIAHQYMSLSFMPAVGVSVACTALVGRYQGMRRPDLAASRAWLCVRLAVGYMTLCGVLFVVFREPMVRLFIPADSPPEAAETLVRLGSKFMIATAAFQMFDATAMVLSGALRGAGDTVMPGVATIVASWVILAGGGAAMVMLVPRLESLGPWIAAGTYIFVLCVILLVRFLGGRWKGIRLVE